MAVPPSLNLYMTEAVASSPSGWAVGCQTVSNVWDASTLKWTTTPALNPGNAGSVCRVWYTQDTPGPSWRHWADIPTVVDPTVLSFTMGLSVINESAYMQNNTPSWIYFAKPGYVLESDCDPCTVYAVSNPFGVKTLAISPATVTGGGTTTCTVTLSLPAPASGTLSLYGTDPCVPLQQVAIAQGATQATVALQTSAVTTARKVMVLAFTAQDGPCGYATITVTP